MASLKAGCQCEMCLKNASPVTCNCHSCPPGTSLRYHNALLKLRQEAILLQQYKKIKAELKYYHLLPHKGQESQNSQWEREWRLEMISPGHRVLLERYYDLKKKLQDALINMDSSEEEETSQEK